MANYQQPPQSSASSGKLQPGTKVQVGQYVVQVDKFLSEGGFAHVYVASLVSPSSVEGFPTSQNRFVLKRMAVPDKAGLVEVRKEVDVMKQLRPHKHIVHFIEASASSIPASKGYEIFILMEWCPGGGIIDLLNSRLQNRLTESEILKIFSDTVAAVAHMHSQNPILIHRDLKVENILVASPNLYKLCDFGSTTSPLPHPPQTSAEILALEADLNKHTTLQYRAPEMVDVWSRKGVTEKADIWALGVFLYKLCYYTTPFEAHGPMAIMNVQYQIPTYPAYSNSIKYLIGTMLQELAQSRPDIWQVHEHLCRLRGVTPFLRRPNRKQTPSNLPSNVPPTSNPTPLKPVNQSKEDGLDSIFTAAPPSAATLTKPESVMPMRRGRPTVKSKPGTEGPVPNGELVFQSAASPSAPIVPPKKNSPPEESDLFAREAAAGFGDAFLSPSPKANSFKPTSSGPSAVNKSFGAVRAPSHSHLPLKSYAPSPPNQSNLKTTAPSSAFEDLVPPRKKSPPKTLNQMRSGLGMVTSTSTGPSFGARKLADDSSIVAGKPHHEPSNSLSVAKTNLLQKTGPQAFSSPTQATTINHRILNITQKTGPAHTSTPSLSDWLKKDQPVLVSRSTQTSPSLLSRWMTELTLAPSLNVLNGYHKSTDQSVQPTTFQNEIKKSSSTCHFDSRPNVEEPEIQSRFKPPQGHQSVQPTTFPKEIKQSLSTPHFDSHPSVAKAENQNRFKPPQGLSASAGQEVSSSDSSDEEPEEAEGQKAYRGLGPSAVSLAPKPPFKPASFPTQSWETSKGHVDQMAGGQSSSVGKPVTHAVADDRHDRMFNNPSPATTSTTGISSSEAMTEEDEEVKLKRRAAIAKFAPAPKPVEAQPESDPTTPRDPFSSSGPSWQAVPSDPPPGACTSDKPVRRQVGPPLRAPKPRSLKSAAAINNLVSRYENLSGPSESRPDSSLAGPVGGKPISKRQSIFKPVPSVSSSQNNNSNNLQSERSDPDRPGPPAASKPVHIPKKSLGPGLPLSPGSDHEEEKFTSVNDLKSKWESGALRSVLPTTRAPRADYGQT